MSRKVDRARPPDHYAWMAEIPDETGRLQRVALCATLDPSRPPSPLSTGDLPTAISLKGVAQAAADNIEVDVTLYAFRGEEVLDVVKPRLIKAVPGLPQADLPQGLSDDILRGGPGAGGPKLIKH